jgi:hypothetical protein
VNLSKVLQSNEEEGQQEESQMSTDQEDSSQ